MLVLAVLSGLMTVASGITGSAAFVSFLCGVWCAPLTHTSVIQLTLRLIAPHAVAA